MDYCINCGEVAKRSGSKFCGEECKNIYYGIGEELTCPCCNGTFTRRYVNQIYCDRKCSDMMREYRKRKGNIKTSPMKHKYTSYKDETLQKKEFNPGDHGDMKVDFDQTGQNIFVPGIDNDFYGLVTPSL